MLTVAALWLAAVIAPGPNLLAVLTATARSRRAGLQTVAGVGAGTAFWGLAGSLGMQAAFAAQPVLFVALKAVGGAYLVWLGLRLLWRSGRPAAAAPLPRGRAVLAGFLTSVSNPKSALLVASLFAATMPAHAAWGTPLRFGLAATTMMVGISVLWYGAVACAASGRAAGALLGPSRRWIDRAAGVAFAGFGLRLVWSAR